MLLRQQVTVEGAEIRLFHPNKLIPCFNAPFSAESNVSATAAGHGLMGMVFSVADASHFYVAYWKAAKSGTVDSTLDSRGYYGSYQAYTANQQGTNVIYYYYATAGLTIKRFAKRFMILIGRRSHLSGTLVRRVTTPCGRRMQQILSTPTFRPNLLRYTKTQHAQGLFRAKHTRST